MTTRVAIDADRQRPRAVDRGRAAPHAARRAARRPRADRARRSAASSASAARARSCSTAGASTRASCSRPRRTARASTTVEGLAAGGRLDPLQEAFLDTGAAQCGFCIPGQLMAAHALLAPTPHPTRAEVEEGLAGNLCRCGGYEQIIEAVLARRSRAGARRAGRDRAVDRPGRRRRRRPASAGVDRVTGRQAYVADIRLEDALHVKLVTLDVRPRADRRDRHDAPRWRSPASGWSMTAADLPAADAALRPAVPATGRCSPSARRTTTASRSRPSPPRRWTPPRRRRALVRVEYEELPAVFTLAAALDPAAPLVQDPSLRPDDPLREHERPARAPLRLGRRRRATRADVVVEGTYAFPMVTQFAIEPHAFIAAPDGDGIAVWSSIQHPYWLQRVIAGAARTCRSPRCASSRPTRAARSAASSTPSTSRSSRSWRCAPAGRSASC